jgi:hypothetical protein
LTPEKLSSMRRSLLTSAGVESDQPASLVFSLRVRISAPGEA